VAQQCVYVFWWVDLCVLLWMLLHLCCCTCAVASVLLHLCYCICAVASDGHTARAAVREQGASQMHVT
jgi:hypothetical protein